LGPACGRNQNKKDKAEQQIDAPLSDPELNIDEKVRVLAQYLGGFRSDEEAAKVIRWAGLIAKSNPEDAKAWAFQGDFLNLNKQKKEARTSYLKSLHIKSSNQQVWEQVILIGSELNEVDSVAKHTSQALVDFPNNGVFWYYKGRANLFLKQNKEAAEALENARRYQPDNVGLVFECNAMLGDLYNQTKEFAKSDEAYEAALKSDGNNAMVLNNYSYFLSVRKEKLAYAKKLGEKLVSLEADNPTYQDTYGWVLFKKGDFSQALLYLEKAVADSTSSGVIYEHYGDALFKNGKIQQAVSAWKTALQKGGDVTPKLQEKVNQGKYID
jgi:tetratricopeptide (TPR) repeat protein